jgi:hypothetical protein
MSNPRPPLLSKADHDDDDDEQPVIKPPAPPRSRPLNDVEFFDMYKNTFSLFLIVACPALMILPPRRFNSYAALQGFGLLWAVNEQSERRTGRDIIYWSEAPVRWARSGARAVRGTGDRSPDPAAAAVAVPAREVPMLVPATPTQRVSVPDEARKLGEQVAADSKAISVERSSQETKLEPRNWALHRLKGLMWAHNPEVRGSERKREG